MKSTNFLTDNLWLRKYIEIQYYRTAIKEYSRNDRMCKEIYLISKYIYEETDQENTKYICNKYRHDTDDTHHDLLIQ